MKPQGFTLIELLIVLLIIGLGWFTILPRLDMSQNGEEQPLQRANELLSEAVAKATSANTLQRIYLVSGGNQLEWEESEVRLPASLSRAEINGEQATGRRHSFVIYPAGHMDEVELVLTDGTRLESNPLKAELRRE